MKTVTQGPNQFTEYATHTVNTDGRSIVADDRIWIPNAGGLGTGQSDEIFGLSTSGSYVSYALPRGACNLYALRKASDGFWFVRAAAFTVGKITLNGDIFEKPLDRAALDVESDGTPYFDGLLEYGLDGTLWTTSHHGMVLDRARKEGATMKHTEFRGQEAAITVAIIPDAHGGAWLARFDYKFDKVMHVTADGRIDVEATAPRNCTLNGLTMAAGSIWFSCQQLRKIGKVAANGDVTIVDLPYPLSFSIARIFGDPKGLWIVDFGRVFRLNITESPGPGNTPAARQKGGA